MINISAKGIPIYMRMLIFVEVAKYHKAKNSGQIQEGANLFENIGRSTIEDDI